jgi:hypothetical protein
MKNGYKGKQRAEYEDLDVIVLDDDAPFQDSPRGQEHGDLSYTTRKQQILQVRFLSADLHDCL